MVNKNCDNGDRGKLVETKRALNHVPINRTNRRRPVFTWINRIVVIMKDITVGGVKR